MNLNDLIGELCEAGFHVDVENLLDTLWLASLGRKITLYELAPDKGDRKSPAAPAGEQPSALPSTSDISKGPTSSAARRGLEETVMVYDSGEVSCSRPETSQTLISVKRSSGLENKLLVTRSLRPLRRQFSGGKFKELDEVKTVQASSDLSTTKAFYLTPVFRCRPERWYDAEVVVEDDNAILFWHDIVREFCETLRNTGAFRLVRSWRLRLPSPDLTRTPTKQSGILEFSCRR